MKIIGVIAIAIVVIGVAVGVSLFGRGGRESSSPLPHHDVALTDTDVVRSAGITCDTAGTHCEAELGLNIMINVTVENRGNVAENDVEITASVKPAYQTFPLSHVGKTSIGTLEAGQTMTVSIDWTTASGGGGGGANTYWIYGDVSIAEEAPEDRANNHLMSGSVIQLVCGSHDLFCDGRPP